MRSASHGRPGGSENCLLANLTDNLVTLRSTRPVDRTNPTVREVTL